MAVEFCNKNTLFANGPVFTGGGGMHEKAWVLVKEGRIASVSAEPITPGADARVVDLGGRTLLPGFIDCHVHLYLDSTGDPFASLAGVNPQELALKAASHAVATIMAGVTTVRDLGDMHYAVMAVRDAVNQGLLPGPRILAAGRVVCITGGHGWHIGGRQADGPEEVRKAVREQIRAGCDVVKLMATGGVLTPGGKPGQAQLDLEELAAGADEAHRLGRRAAAHAQGTEGIKNALRAGIDTIEHGNFLDPEAMELMQNRGAVLVPTLSAPVNILRGGVEGGVPAGALETTGRVKEAHFESFRRAADCGVKMAMGTDAGTPFNRHGANLEEIALMAASGCKTEKALLAATGGAAKALGLDDVGIVAPGMLADLVVVKGDPLADPGLLASSENIICVMKDGRFVKAPDRD